MAAEYNGGDDEARADARPAGSWLRARLATGPPLLLDGATGTELERRGVVATLPLWSTHALLHAPDVVADVQRAYAEAGAEILTANTFRTQRHTLRGTAHEGDAAALSRLAIEIARDAAHSAPQRILVAGSAPPLEDCYRPDRVPDAATLEREHGQHAEALASAGADLILVETMNSVREAVAATRAAAETGLPVVVSFVSWHEGRLLSGEPLSVAFAAIAASAPLAVAVNCLPASAVPACLASLRGAGRPFGVYANLGAPDPARQRSEDLEPAAFAAHAASWIAAGARLVGGCCGTGPEHIRAIADTL